MFAIPLKIGVAVSALAHQWDNPETSILTWCSTRCRLEGVLLITQLVSFYDAPTNCERLRLRSERLYQVTVTIPIIKRGKITAERFLPNATGHSLKSGIQDASKSPRKNLDAIKP